MKNDHANEAHGEAKESFPWGARGGFVMYGNMSRDETRPLTARPRSYWLWIFLFILARNCKRPRIKARGEAAIRGILQAARQRIECVMPEIRVSKSLALLGSEGLIRPDNAGVATGLL